MPRRRIRWGRILLLLLALAGAVWAWQILSDPRIPIALDAGHGGEDPGASGVIRETQLTEATVRALASYLEADPSYRVILCRDLNGGAGLNSRWKKANLHRARLLLSVHGNSSEDPTASGFEAYPAPPGRENHAESLRFASLLASRMAETGIRLRERRASATPITSIRPRFSKIHPLPLWMPPPSPWWIILAALRS